MWMREESTLFGKQLFEDSLFVPRSEIKAFVRGELAKEQRDFEAVASQRRASRVERGGNVLNVQENKKIAQDAERVKNAYNKLVNLKGPVSDAVNAIAGRYVDAPKAVKERLRKEAAELVKGALAKELGNAA